MNRDSNKLCSGCGVCAGTCPQNALKMERSNTGFYRPVRQKGCNNCGECIEVCPFNNHPDVKTITKKDKVFGKYVGVYSAYSKNGNIRHKSSTAGFIRTFVSSILKHYDGVITLTSSDNPLMPEVEFLKDKNDILNKMAKSTYFATDYSEAVRILRNTDGKFIIVGLPCQIAGIKNANKKLKRNIFTIELFCGAIYSLNLMEKYFKLKGIKPNVLDFKDKYSGWHNPSLTLSGTDLLNSEVEKTIKTDADSDEFYYALRNRFCTQDACLNCTYCFSGVADMQVGDFWGEKYQSNEEGVNLVVTRSYLADLYLKFRKKLKIRRCNIKDVHMSQPWFVQAFNRIEKFKTEANGNIYTGMEVPINDTVEFNLEMNKSMQEYIDKCLSLSALKMAYLVKKYFMEKDLKANVQLNSAKNKNKFVILLSDSSTLNSFGDQAMNASILDQIYSKYPDAEISYFVMFENCNYEALSNYYNIDKFELMKSVPGQSLSVVERFKHQAQECGTLIVMGADILDGVYGIQQAVDYYSIMIQSILMGMNVIVTGSSFSTNQYPEVKDIIALADVAGLNMNARDDISFERMKAYGFNNVTQVADIAFLFDEAKYKISSFASDLKNKLNTYKQQKKNIIGLHLHATADKAEDLIEKVIRSLDNFKDSIFVLFPHDYRELCICLSDKEMIELAQKKFEEKDLNVINAYELSSEIDVKSVIGCCDLLITSRMHAAIAAFSKNVPVISFVYTGKFEGLYNFYKFEKNLMFDKEYFSPAELAAAIKYLLDNDFTDKIANCNKGIIELSKKNFVNL